MVNAMWVAALVGGVCAFLSAYLMLKGWSLIGDALSHAIVPGVAGAYMLGLPFALGAFLSRRLLAALGMPFVKQRTQAAGRRDHRPDLHLVLRARPVHGLAVSPTAVNIQTIVLGNILGISRPTTRCSSSSSAASRWRSCSSSGRT